MSYQKAMDVLPLEIIIEIQKYIDGGMLYIPKKAGDKFDWGNQTETKKELRQRNQKIYRDFLDGISYQELAQRYFLSVKSIQRIIRQCKIQSELNRDV